MSECVKSGGRNSSAPNYVIREKRKRKEGKKKTSINPFSQSFVISLVIWKLRRQEGLGASCLD